MTEMKTLIILMGLPRSGKSTYAKRQGYPVVNPDSIRLALHGKNFIETAEPMIWVIAKYMVKALFYAGHDKVILDATNLTRERRQEWESDEWENEYIYFKTTKRICIKRAFNDNREDLIPVIKKMDKEKEIDLFEINGVINE